jgi:large subunit ribosomal protein L15e
MGLHKHIGKLWKKHSSELVQLNRKRYVTWRRESVTVRIKRPTRLDRARSLGYRPKSGVIIVRQRVDRGGRKRPDIKGGRRSKHARQIKILDKSYQLVAEERTAKRYVNMEVLNSYFVGKDGQYYWYEVILVDAEKPEIKTDKNLKWLTNSRRRVFRGMTSAGRKTRGLRNKGKGAEKMRPSRTARVRAKYKKQHRDYLRAYPKQKV